MEVITDTAFLGLPLFRRGKVRDIYEVGDLLLIISTDRISAFDVIMDEGIPGKGEVLNQLAAFWLDKTRDIIENHLVTTDMGELPPGLAESRNSASPGGSSPMSVVTRWFSMMSRVLSSQNAASWLSTSPFPGMPSSIITSNADIRSVLMIRRRSPTS